MNDDAPNAPAAPEATDRPRPRPVRIGLTGPIGCGKSTVARWLVEREGVELIDADVVARDVLGPGTPQVEAVYARFGEALRRSDGTLDRTALGRIVFTDPAELAALEAIVHPAVRPRILEALDAARERGARAVVVEAIKLVEGGLADMCDEVWLVACDPEVQAGRLADRGDEPDDAAAKVRSQGGMVARLRPRATRILDSSGTPEATYAQVIEALEAARRRGEEGTAGAVSPRA